MLENIPYKPGQLVYFVHEDGIKRGRVMSVSCVLNTKNEVWLWQVEEITRGGMSVIHEVQRNHLCVSWEAMEEKQWLIHSFRAIENEQKEDEE